MSVHLNVNLKVILFLWISTSRALLQIREDECTYTQYIESRTDLIYYIYNSEYPQNYSGESNQTWCLYIPENATGTFSFNCELGIPDSDNCRMDALTISSDVDAPRPFCGSGEFQTKSNSNNAIVKFQSSKITSGGNFLCHVQAHRKNNVNSRTIVYNNCDCGYSYNPRVVGGQETGINEFPFMAGIIDSRKGAIVACGATIISKRYVVTAEHCITTLDINLTGVLVGEHNTETGSETPATQLIRASKFIHYPYYSSKTKQYDIALILLKTEIKYSIRVGPVCLPFQSRNWDLTGQQVTILGWGTTEFGGPRSKFLRKAYVDLIDITKCINSYGSDIEPNTQLCAYRKNSDACQFDSGGPLVWLNPYIERYELVGIVSYGKSCASADPSVNTKVAPFIQWILDFTQGEDFCYLGSN